MKRLFIQFYLLLITCFLVMTLLVGFVYKNTAERTGQQSLEDLMNSALSLIRTELRTIPPHHWNQTLEKMDWNLSFKLHIEPLGARNLDEPTFTRLKSGKIVSLDEQFTFLQRIPNSKQVLVVGPIPYLFYLHQMRLLDFALLLLIGLSLAIPVFIWMRPHWHDLLTLDRAAQRFGEGHLQERTDFSSLSTLHRLGSTFNQMADNISTLLDSKKQLINAIAHELRTPLARLRYRLATLDTSLSEPEQEGLHRDIHQLESLINELLTYAKFEHQQPELNKQYLNLQAWLNQKCDELQSMQAGKQLTLVCRLPKSSPTQTWIDPVLFERLFDNLVNNALRYCSHQVSITLSYEASDALLQIEDDGIGIPAEERTRVFEPFVRLDPSRDRTTGGCGLGLAIVSNIAQAFNGSIHIEQSRLGGACFVFRWPAFQPITTD